MDGFGVQMLPRERKKAAYMAAVKERYKNLPDIKRIDRYGNVMITGFFMSAFFSEIFKVILASGICEARWG